MTHFPLLPGPCLCSLLPIVVFPTGNGKQCPPASDLQAVRECNATVSPSCTPSNCSSSGWTCGVNSVCGLCNQGQPCTSSDDCSTTLGCSTSGTCICAFALTMLSQCFAVLHFALFPSRTSVCAYPCSFRCSICEYVCPVLDGVRRSHPERIQRRSKGECRGTLCGVSCSAVGNRGSLHFKQYCGSTVHLGHHPQHCLHS